MNKMIRIVVVFCAIQLSTIAAMAQAEKFDLVSFTAPKGWQRSVEQSALQFSKREGNGEAMIILFKALPTGKGSKATFDASWGSIVKGLFDKVDTPGVQPTVDQNGWAIENGAAIVEKGGSRAVANLMSATAGGKVINLLIITNSESFQSAIDAFVASIVLPQVKSADATRSSTLGSEPSNNEASTVSSFNGRYSCLKLVYRNNSSVYDPAGLGFSVSGNSYTVVGGTGGKVAVRDGAVEFAGGRLNGYRGEMRDNNGKSYIFFRVNFTEIRRNESIRFGDMQCYRQ